MKPTRLSLAEHATVVYHHTVEFGTTLEDVLKPAYWTHVAAHMRPGHRIEVMSPTIDWWAMLIVRAATKIEAAVAVIEHKSFTAPAVAAAPEQPYEVKWRGPTAKWSIVRKADGGIVKDQIASQDEANRWLLNHEKAMAA